MLYITNNKQMSKPNLLIWCDAPVITTGFGIVAKNLFSDLHKDFEVDIVGINYFGYQKFDSNKWHIYPVQKDDLLGMEPFKRAVADKKYAVIILFQDIFHISNLIPSLREAVKDNTKVVIYFPVDGGPLDPEWKNVFEKADKSITYTKFAISTIKESYPELDTSDIDYLYHGVEESYKKLSRQERKRIKSEFRWADQFVAVNVNRYQPRKNIGATIRAWSLFAKGYKLCECGNAYPKNLHFCDANRCGPDKIVKETKGHSDVSLYLHMRIRERANGPGTSNDITRVLIENGFSQKDLNSGIVYLQSRDLYAKPFSLEDMNKLYNAADINISTASGEGVGLSLIEASATGTTTIAPRNSAILEMLEGHGVLVDNVPNGIYTQPFDNSFRRPNVDTLKFAEALEDQYQKWIANGRKKIINDDALKAAQDKFLWEDKKEYITKLLKSYL